MERTIITKFDIGDCVYSAYCLDNFYPSKNKFVIKDVIVKIHNDAVTIHYVIQQDDYTDRVPEGWVFETYEECIKWCEKNNKFLFSLTY